MYVVTTSDPHEVAHTKPAHDADTVDGLESVMVFTHIESARRFADSLARTSGITRYVCSLSAVELYKGRP